MIKCKKIFNIISEVVTPIHIGNGNTVSSLEYLRLNNKIYLVKFDRVIDYFIKNSRGEINFVELANSLYNMFDKKEGTTNLNNLFTDKGLSIEKFLENKSNYLYYINENGIDAGSSVEIELCAKGNDNIPYIPGSSVKGYIRTAVLYSFLKKEKNKGSNLFKALKNKIKSLLEKDNFHKFDNIENFLNNKIFVVPPEEDTKAAKRYSPERQPNAQNDIFRFISIPDITNENFEIDLCKSVKIYKTDNSEAIPIYSEYIIPGHNAFKIQIGIDICGLKKNKEFADMLQTVFEVSDVNHLEDNIKNQIINSIKEFSADMLNLITSEIYDAEIADLNYKNNIYLNLGKHTNYFLKTIGALFKDDKNLFNLILEYFQATTDDFPITYSAVQYNNKKYLPGWVEIKV